MRFYLLARLMIYVGIMSLLSSCQNFHSWLTSPQYAQRLIIQSTDDLNESRPVRLDIALTTNEEVARQLSTMDAATYFRERDQIVRDHPYQILIGSWEIVPAHRLEERLRPGIHDPFQGFVFADYPSQGAHRAPLPPIGDVAIMLHRTDLNVSSL